MKQQSTMLAAVFAAMLPTLANALCTRPECRTGTCKTAAWSESRCKFECVDSCTCDGDRYICAAGASVLGCFTDAQCGTGYKCNQDSNTCEKCTGCSNCASDTTWFASGTGYETKVTRTCNCNTCTESASFRCAAGYYGNTTTGTSGCAACPTGGTSAPDAKLKTECYIPANTTQTDSIGTYVITSNCYYSN